MVLMLAISYHEFRAIGTQENSFKSFRKVITIMLSTQAENGLWAVVGLHFRADDDMVIVAIVWQRFSTPLGIVI